jgi:hypothetical protein
LRFALERLEDVDEQLVRRGVFQSAFTRFGQGRAGGACYYLGHIFRQLVIFLILEANE